MLDEYKLGNLYQISYDEINRKRREIQFVEKSAVVQEECKQCKYFQILDVYRPKNAKGKKLPIIVSVHGGGYMVIKTDTNFIV